MSPKVVANKFVGVRILVAPHENYLFRSLYTKKKDHQMMVFFLSFGGGIEDSHHSAEGAGFAYAQSAYLRREEISALIYNLAEHFLQISPRAAYPYAKKSRSSLDGLLFSFVVPN